MKMFLLCIVEAVETSHWIIENEMTDDRNCQNELVTRRLKFVQHQTGCKTYRHFWWCTGAMPEMLYNIVLKMKVWALNHGCNAERQVAHISPNETCCIFDPYEKKPRFFRSIGSNVSLPFLRYLVIVHRSIVLTEHRCVAQ
jgi:hypothetical protein